MKMRASTRIIRCPKCGYEFDLSYARTFACGGCPSSAIGCQYARCPMCGHEWPLM
ncbi:MAG: hypothetical protein LM598_03050 [Candidatus Verstraetearchaeota archaeon]|nr:hypothetical protein [Candidatus Verstraetearchaeota archaeon]